MPTTHETGLVLPTLEEAIERVSADLDSNIDGAESRLRRRITRALALAMGGLSYFLHLLGARIAEAALPNYASESGILRWAKILRLTREAAAAASGTVRYTGVNGTLIPNGTLIVRVDGREYTSTSPITVAAGIADVPVLASEGGIDGNAAENVVLSLASPIAGIDTDGLVRPSPDDVAGGTDLETIAALQGRVIDKLANPPMGGSYADYVKWTKDAVANTRTVWVSRHEPSLGHVTIRFVVEPDDGDPLDAKPSTQQVDAAQDYIGGTAAEDYADAAAPVPTIADRIDVRELTTQNVTVEITGLDPDTSDVKAAIATSLDAMILRRAVPGTATTPGTLKVSWFWEAISSAAGEVSHELTKIDGGAPADVSIAADKWPDISSINYV